MTEETIRAGLVISRLERMRSSFYGNPRFQVTFTDGTSAPTEVDGSVGYGIENSGFRDTPLRVTFNRYGHVSYIVRMEREGKADGQNA